jgi:transcriptional adapter 2-beta
LKAVEHYGFGNWDDISKDIETKNPEDAKEEYISKFLNGNIGKHTWKMENDLKLSLIDHTSGFDLTIDELQVDKLAESTNEICTQDMAAQLGYMPFRDDFEREYDVTAEQLVSNLALTTEDDDIESALKLAQVDIYNRRLRERARKKRIARDYRLIQEFFRKFENGKAKSLNQTKDERGLRLSLKNFRQFYSNEAFERLIYTLERERILRIRLTELCRYRWNGLTKIDECEHFEKHAAANQHQTSCPFGYGHYKQVCAKLFSTSDLILLHVSCCFN